MQMKIHGVSPGKSQRDSITIDGILERYNKERILFVTSVNSWLSSSHNGKDADTFLAQLLLSLTIDPGAELAKTACKSVNTLLRNSPRAFEGSDVTLILSECFNRASLSVTRTLVSETGDSSKVFEQLKGLIQEVSETLEVSLRLDDSSLAPSPSTVDRLINSSQGCLKIGNPWIQASALQVLSAAIQYTTRAPEPPKSYLESILEDVIELVLKYECHDEIQWRSFSLFCVLTDHLSKTQADKLIAHSTKTFSGQSHQVIGSFLLFIEKILNHRSQDISVDENLLAMLCYCVELGLEQKNPAGCDGETSHFTALQVLASLASTDDSLGALLLDHQKVIAALYGYLNDLNSPNILPSMYIIGHICNISELCCDKILHTKDGNLIRSLCICLAHSKDAQIQMVAAWVLGVIGSSSPTNAQKVTESGGILTLLDTLSKQKDCDSMDALFHACLNSCIAVLSKLEHLPALVALVKLEICSEEIVLSLFCRIRDILSYDPVKCTDFVQTGGLEVLVSKGESAPSLESPMKDICDMYPQELVNRCSPRYMSTLIESFRRESMRRSNAWTIDQGFAPRGNIDHALEHESTTTEEEAVISTTDDTGSH